MVVDLYNGVYRVLANDETVLTYLGIGVGATALEKAKRIQKRAKPQRLAENMPLISFYALPGAREKGNLQVYNTNFVFTVFTKEDVSLAQRLADRIQQLFEGVIHPLMGVENFESLLVTMHESESELADSYAFSVVINFSIALED